MFASIVHVVFGSSRNLVSTFDTTPHFTAAIRASGLRLRLRVSVTYIQLSINRRYAPSVRQVMGYPEPETIQCMTTATSLINGKYSSGDNDTALSTMSWI